MRILAVYPGRFQPFHKGHAQVYQWLKKKFGNAVIATSDKVEAPKSPFNFAEKKRMMMLAGVPESDITQVTNPYIAKEVLANYDPKTTVLLFAVSQKDMEEDPRFNFKPTKSGKPGYLQPFKGNENKLKPFGDRDAPKGYVVVTPTFTFDVLGKPATSASELRKQFVSLSPEKQKAFITDLFGRYSAPIHKLMDKKIGDMIGRPKTIKKLKEDFDIGLTLARAEMPQIGKAIGFINYLKQNHIDASRQSIDPDELRSSQIEFDDEKIEGLRQKPSGNPIIVSSDGYVIDGHHRWLADHFENRNCDAYVCDLNVLDLLYHANNYCSQLNESIDRESFEDMMKKFVGFASDHLGIKTIPNIRYKTSDDDYTSFAAYSPSKNEVHIMTKNRHPMDIYRSIAHELVHHKQNEEGRIGKDVAKEGETGSHIENEANAKAGVIMRDFGRKYPQNFDLSFVSEEARPKYLSYKQQLNEGIHDPGKLKAIFLAGGPGSGKDYVMKSVLQGEGLVEINSDVAFEYLMKKHGLDMEMPKSETVERNIARGKAKITTKKKEELALAGRLGLIINGTADDLEKIGKLKKRLEGDGYETMMVFVNTSNEVSRQRNVERGKLGGRKVQDGTDKEGKPDNTPDTRQEKWESAQKNIGELQKIFGNKNFTVIDNSTDIRKVDAETKDKVKTNFDRVRRMAQQFVRAENQNPNAKKWIESEAKKRGITDVKTPAIAKPIKQPKTVSQQPAHQPDNELMAQARKLGLSYFGFGRFGRKVNGVNKVMYMGKDGKLVQVNSAPAKINEDKDPCWNNYKQLGMKKKNGKEVPNCVPANEEISMDDKFNSYLANTHNRDVGTTPLRKLYASMTPGQSEEIQAVNEAKKKIKLVKKIAQEDNNIPRQGLPVSGGYGPETTQYRPFTVTGFTMAESIAEWAHSPATQQKFIQKYGDDAEKRLYEAAMKLEQSGCGTKVVTAKKSVAKIKEAKGVADMGTVPSTGKEEVNETISKEGSQYVVRSEKGKNLGKSSSKAGAVKRLRQVEYFKHKDQ